MCRYTGSSSIFSLYREREIYRYRDTDTERQILRDRYRETETEGQIQRETDT